MKAKTLFSILSRKELTNIATEIANVNIAGLKIKSKSFIDLVAKLNGLSAEALLNQDTAPCFSVVDLNAIFDHTSGTTKIASIGFKIKVEGFWIDKITICEGTFDENGFVRDPSVNLTGSDNGIDSESGLTRKKLNENLQVATNHAFFLVNEFIENKQTFKNENDLKNFINGNWKVSHIGKK